MNFNRLIAFVSAAKHLNVTRAAAQLQITQPAMSKQLRLLQSECEVKLYFRRSKARSGRRAASGLCTRTFYTKIFSGGSLNF